MAVARDIETAKFTFEKVFDQAHTLHGDKTQAKQITAEDIIAARQEGYNEGFSAGKNDEELIVGRDLNSSLDEISAKLSQIVQTMDEIEQRTGNEARGLAMIIARKLVLNLKKIYPTAGIETLVEDSLKQLSHAQHIVIRLNETQMEPLKSKLEQISGQLGFQEKVMIVPDPDIKDSDCRIEWADGGIERNTHQIESQIEEIIGRYFPLSATAEPEKTPTKTPHPVKETEDE